LIVSVGAISYFMIFSLYPALRDFPWINLPAVLLGMAVSVVGLRRAVIAPEVYRGRVMGSIGLLFSAALGGLFCAYIFVISYWLPEPSATTANLTRVPELTLVDHAGRPFDLGGARERKLLIVFYRGYW
jgi:hypothetical protein